MDLPKSPFPITKSDIRYLPSLTIQLSHQVTKLDSQKYLLLSLEAMMYRCWN